MSAEPVAGASRPAPETVLLDASDKARRLALEIQAFIANELIPLEAAEGITFESPVTKAQLSKVWKLSAARGIYQAMLPEHLGGRGLSMRDLCLIKETIAASDAVLYSHVLGDFSGPPRVGHLFAHASPKQLDKYLLPVARADKAVCFALTEPGAGSDASRIETRAGLDGNHYVLDGHKRFCTGAPFADIAMVFAVTDPGKGADGISMFFVELDAPGVSVRSDYLPMSGQRTEGDIILDHCRIPRENLLGEPGEGFKLGMSRISLNRLLHCATMLGLAKRSLAHACEFAQRRRQFGRPIAQFQAIQHMLADMHTELYAARSMVLHTALRLDGGDDVRTEASMCKLFCSETAFKIADRAVQVHGGEALIQGHPVEWIFRMLRMFRILTGTSEIQRNTIARRLLQGTD